MDPTATLQQLLEELNSIADTTEQGTVDRGEYLRAARQSFESLYSWLDHGGACADVESACQTIVEEA